MPKIIIPLLLLISLPLATANAAQPNILFILADDLGWRDARCYGSTFYQTPNIDRLAKLGMRYTNAYAASPLCSPTRASILTGQDPGRLRFTTPAGHLPQAVLDPVVPKQGAPSRKAIIPQTRTRLPNTCVTYAEVLQKLGYTTGFFGKWHLGRAPYLPEKQGFEKVVGGREHPGPPPKGHYFSPWKCDTLPVVPAGTHINKVLTDEAITFIQNCKKKGKPFLLNLWYYDVHAPFQAVEELKEKYAAKVSPDNPQRCPTMGAMIEMLDRGVGRVLNELEKTGMMEETLIIFTSDNGGNEYNEVDGTTPTNNDPLRSGKGNIHEGGVRIPLIVVWKGKVKPGTTCDEPVSTVDWFPTLLEVVGAKPPKLPPGEKFDGISIAATFLRGEKLPKRPLFTHFPHYTPATGGQPATSLRQGDWKFYRVYCDNADQTDRFELYNLRDDLSEKNNLVQENPEMVSEFKAMLRQFLKETDALVPVKNPRYDPDAKAPVRKKRH